MGPQQAALRDRFLEEVEDRLAQCAGRWKHLGTGAANQGQIDQAVTEGMDRAKKILGKKQSRVRSIAKPWWSLA